MNAQNVINGSNVVRLRELKAEVARLKSENAVLRDANAQLAAHLDLAVAAARDLESLADGARMVVYDGWNLILGAGREAKDREELKAQALKHLAENPSDLVWIVYDGPRFASVLEGRLRVTYTGGAGEHRADRFICDFVRAAALRGAADRIAVRTRDRDFKRAIELHGAVMI